MTFEEWWEKNRRKFYGDLGIGDLHEAFDAGREACKELVQAEAERDEALKHASIAAVENKRLREIMEPALSSLCALCDEGIDLDPQDHDVIEMLEQALRGKEGK